MQHTIQSTFRWLCVWLLIGLVGCGGYDEVSPTAYQYAKALYSITNRKTQDRLIVVTEGIQKSLDEGELTTQESTWLIDIVRNAEEGKWQAANQAARQIMEDQVH